MLLHRVSLQGFLSHYGREIDGAIAPIDIDFRESGLWLMHGANGSGKSSVFDAITFALFDKARGSLLAKLVNDRSDAALVEVEFENKGERYLVKRRLKLKKSRDGHSYSRAEVWRWDDGKGGWSEVEGIGKIGDWTEGTLQISYENFVSSVILEQGRADQFLRATPKKRREQLMQLLDLSVYEQISEIANKRRNGSRLELKSKEAQIERTPPVSPDELSVAENAVTNAQSQFGASGEAWKRAQKTYDDALSIADWRGQIAEKEAQQGADAAILSEAATIDNAVKERDELNEVLPALRALSHARSASSHGERELDLARAELANSQARQNELAPTIEATREENEAAAAALTRAQLGATQAELDGARAQSDAEVLGQIEELEAQLRECARELETHQSWLDRAESIESRREQIAQLNEIARAVKPVRDATRKVGSAKSAFGEAEAAHQAARARAEEAEKAWQSAQNARAQSDEAGDEWKAERATLAAKLEVNRDILRARDEVGEADECPTCGLELDDPEVRARIDEDRELLRREVGNWQTRLDALVAQLRDLEMDRKARVAAEHAARENFDDASKVANRSEAQAEAAARELAEKQRELRTARDEAGAWADEDFGELQARLAALEPGTIETDFAALGRARDAQTQIEATARAGRAQLQRLPAWNDAKRDSIGELQRDFAGVLARARAELKVAENEAARAAQRQKQAQDDLSEANNAVKIAFALVSQRAATAEGARAELSAQLGQIAAPWSEHRAAREDDALGELAAHQQSLQRLAARADALRVARQRVGNLEGAIGLLRAQIAAIAPENRVEAGEAEVARDAARAELVEAENALDAAKEQLRATRAQRAEFVRCEAELSAAQIEFGRDRDLAEALGRDGLQARIIKQAQENLRGAANGILGRLSKGQWQIDLRAAGEDDSELEIIARDDARGGYERTFDALSGGERFRVAISLAIAIGQMAARGAPMNTLVIDEGFGALDEENRGLMVDNLRHLSEHELKGGRIIVVSHQDDVRDAFGHRYQLSRDKLGYAKVEMALG